MELKNVLPACGRQAQQNHTQNHYPQAETSRTF